MEAETSQNLYLYKMWILIAFIPLVSAFKEFWPNNVGRIHSLHYSWYNAFLGFCKSFLFPILEQGRNISWRFLTQL